MNLEEIEEKLERIQRYFREIYYKYDPNGDLYYDKLESKFTLNLYFFNAKYFKDYHNEYHENSCQNSRDCSCETREFYKIIVYYEPSKNYYGCYSYEPLKLIPKCEFSFNNINFLNDGKMEIFVEKKEYLKMEIVEIDNCVMHPQMLINDCFFGIVTIIDNCKYGDSEDENY